MTILESFDIQVYIMSAARTKKYLTVSYTKCLVASNARLSRSSTKWEWLVSLFPHQCPQLCGERQRWNGREITAWSTGLKDMWDRRVHIVPDRTKYGCTEGKLYHRYQHLSHEHNKAHTWCERQDYDRWHVPDVGTLPLVAELQLRVLLLVEY